MSFTRCCRLATLLASTFSLGLTAQAFPQPTEAPPATHATLPEIVRLSLVEGDVRIARGKQDSKLTGNTWEQASANIPLESGFSLATGTNGRAEIEFEDASTLYLAPNSALTFANLTTKDGAPRSNLTLLSGMVTLNLRPNIPGDAYVLQTPTHSVGVAYGDTNYSRVTSFLDGVEVTPLESTHLALSHVTREVTAGTTYDLEGAAVRIKRVAPTPETLAWDAWVKQRIDTRAAAMHSVMEQANLKTPLPGLADMAGNGTFVSCVPYGTCWVPTNGWVSQQSSAVDAAVQNSNQPPIRPLPEAQSASAAGTVNTVQPRLRTTALDTIDDDFPCDPWRLWYRHTLFAYPDNLYPYDWAVCHAGYWLFRNNRYMWVAGTHKHHRCPVHWVKYQGKLGYVPMHPRDQRGQPPVNLRHGIYSLTDKPNQPIERLAFDTKAPPKVLDATPKEFREPAPPMLARAESPELGVHFMHESPRTNISGTPARNSASSLTFDQHSERFMLATRVTEGGRTQTFTEPMSDRGGHVASASEGGYHPSSSGGGVSHAGGYSGGGGSSGGHSGGGFSGGGGGGHSSGGGSSSSSSGGGSSASSSGGGGGGHH